MSDDENNFATNTIPLLKEYSTKFASIRNEIHNLQIQIRQPPVNQPHIMQQRALFAQQLETRKAVFSFLSTPIQELIDLATAEAAKQQMDLWLAAELKVRLAELEYELKLAKRSLFGDPA